MEPRTRLDALRGRIDTRDSLARKLQVWRMQGKKIVFTNGCFDILHLGHIDYLARAADLGNVLIVGVNSDASVRRLGKNGARPIQDERSRAHIIASLAVVDSAVIFDEDTPLELIRMIGPDVLVKGADYDAAEENAASPKYIVGSAEVRAAGGLVKTIELLPGYSTTAIENKIRNSNA
ncbi:MAG: adenylyltransferase/cytidyltransferase family protein [Bacteroidota bacterium]